MPKSTSYEHLIGQFVPEHYDLTFDLDEKRLRFAGTVSIKGHLPASQSTIVLHAKDLVVHGAKLGQKELSLEARPEADEVVLSLPQAMQGPLTLELEFSGKISKQMHGIYACNFEVDGRKKRIIATQFESHHAREAFPCVDEPAAKATFDLTLRTSQALPVVLANVPLATELAEATIRTTKFERTPRMSPYLLAFVAGELHSIEGKTKDNVLVRSWVHIGIDKDQLSFSLEHAIRSIEFFNDYFGIDYPLSKCDQVALPDFEMGAMENWGLITYRETVLLCDPKNRSHDQERYCAMVISHELSHQWFGNLVTMKWWDDLWLNESFASIMEFVALDALYPDWRMWEQFVVDDALRAVSRDVLPGVQPVGLPVAHPDEIHSLFDPAIVYAKGSRLLNMLRCFIGDAVFQKGLQAYFHTHAYDNTSREDLWSALSDASGKDISKLMTPWLTQPNVPLLRVKRDGDRQQISQHVFMVGGEPELATSTWPIPLFSQPELAQDLLSSSTDTLQADSFVRFNAGARAHCLVFYENEEDRKLLARSIAQRELPAPDRSNSLHDLVLLARGGLLSIDQAMRVVIACESEDREAVWKSLGYVASAANTVAQGHEDIEAVLRRVVWLLAKPAIDRLGWYKSDGEDTNDSQVRNTAISLASYSEDQAFVSTMQPLYRKYHQDWLACDADLRPTVMATSIEHAFAGAFENMLAIIRDAEARPDIKADASMALTSARASDEIDALINMLKDTDLVRSQDMPRWFSGLMNNQYARRAAWQWMRTEWPWIHENYAQTASYDRFPRIAASALKNHDELTEYEAFFTPKLGEISLKRTIEIGINDIATRVAWREQDQAPLRDWLHSTQK